MPKSFSHKLTLAGAGQKTHETCWLASYKMIMTAANKSTYPIEGRLRAAGIDFDDYYKNGMPDTVYTKAAGALGLQHWPGSTFNAKPGFFDVGLTDGAEALLKILEVGPCWVSKFGDNNYHIIVASGYDDKTERITFANPYPGPTNAVEDSMSANLFAKYITRAGGSVQQWRYRIGEDD